MYLVSWKCAAGFLLFLFLLVIMTDLFCTAGLNKWGVMNTNW